MPVEIESHSPPIATCQPPEATIENHSFMIKVKKIQKFKDFNSEKDNDKGFKIILFKS